MNFIFIVVAIWFAAIGIWWLVSKFARSADVDKIKSRLAGSKAKKEKSAVTTPGLIRSEKQTGQLIDSFLKKYRLQARISELLEQAGLRWNTTRFIHASLGLFLGGFGLAWMLLPPEVRQVSWVVGILGGIGPLMYAVRKRKARLRRFEEIFPDALEFVARSMRAGHAFSVSLEMIHREFQEPVAGEFRRTFEEHNLGLPLEVALQKLSKRVPSLDVHFFVSAVLLQKRTGGNLAEILDKLAYVIRERFKLRGRIRAVSAHGKMTATALSLIPVAVAVLMFFTNPDYVKFFFTDEVGNIMLGSVVALQLIGYGIMKKIVNIEV
ncbi:MAG: type II secretion system F family protein [Bryobacteraceae bacterium]